jgi:lysozyme
MSTPEVEAMSISPAGLRFIGHWEGFRDHLYNDAAGHCTIGYGHLVHRGHCNGSEPAHFKKGISDADGLALLRADAAGAAAGVNRLVRVPLNQHQFDALASFTFNLGVGALEESTLLTKLNRHEYKEVPSELMKWVKAGGKTLPGLVSRRRAEGALFSQGSYQSADAPAD